ncbi:MAG: SPOR domain-containing protein, partial [Granulosicoccaceae bacterium]
RLLMAGSDEELPLNDRALGQIVADTAGLPGEVDLAAADALNQHYNNRQFKALLSTGHWKAATRQSSKWLAAGSTMLLTGLAMAFFSGSANFDRSGTTVREIAVPASEPQELQLVPPPAEPTLESMAANKPEPATTPAPVAEVSEPAPVVEPAKPAPVAIAEVKPEEPAPIAVNKPEPVITAPTVEIEPKPQVIAAKPATPTAPTPAPTVTAPDPDDFVAGVISGHQWIKRRDPKRFTAQMSAGWNERDLRLFATSNGMTNKTAIYRTERDGKGWFSLVHGDFASPAEAREAIAKLPEVWRKNEPWIRSFASVQKLIN